MGQGLADAIGFPEPPMSAEDSATKLMEQVRISLVSWLASGADVDHG